MVRLGGHQVIPVDFRLVAATHRDLSTAVREGSFRQDLMYRLDVVPIHIPPLRERPRDIPLLVRHQYRSLTGTSLAAGDGVLAPLAALPWKGNVREVMNLVERSYILSQVGEASFVQVLLAEAARGLTGGHESWSGQRAEGAVDAPSGAPDDIPTAADPLDGLLERLIRADLEVAGGLLEGVTRELLEQALRRSGGNKSQAARLLGIDRRAVERRCRKYGL